MGDAIIDEWCNGTVERASAEAACPVFKELGPAHDTPGGAAAVAIMAHDLGADVTFATAFGFSFKDRLMLPDWIECQTYVDVERIDPLKVRFCSREGQWIRIDHEPAHQIKRGPARAWWAALSRRIADKDFDLILLADYGKGALPSWLLRELFSMSPTRALVDPARGRCWSDYEGAWGIKCNTAEFAAVSNANVGEWQIVTGGAAGSLLLCKGQRQNVPQVNPRPICDPTGCGDQYFASLGVELAEWVSHAETFDPRSLMGMLPPIMESANAAAGLQAASPRIGRVSRCEVMREVYGVKVLLHPDELIDQSNVERSRGDSLAFANGGFDLLHAGHLSTLRDAKRQASRLYVGVNGDASYLAAKGRARTVRAWDAAEVIGALACVDWVTIFDDPTPAAIAAILKPDVLVKGGDYRNVRPEEIPGYESAGRLHFAPWVESQSSTAIRQRVATSCATIS